MAESPTEYSLIHYDDLNNQIRSLFLNYQLIKYLKITESVKTLLAYDVKTRENVFIKITSMERMRNNDLVSILRYKALPKIYLCQKIQNYNILIQKASEGTSLLDLKIDKRDILKIFTQLVRLINYFNTYKIRISGLQLRHIYVDKNKAVTVSEIDWMEFDCRIDQRYEEEQTRLLLNILDYLHSKACGDGYGSCSTTDSISGNSKVISVDMKAEKTTKLLRTLKTLAQMMNVLGITEQTHFSDVYIADPLVLYHINQLDIRQFNPLLINEKTAAEYFIYRLVDENIVRGPSKAQFKEIKCLLNRAKKIVAASRSSSYINKIEDSIFKALYKKEQLKKAIIKNRVDILAEEYPWTLKRCFGCVDNRVVLSTYAFFDDKIKMPGRYDGLIVSEIKRENRIIFSKKTGKTIDFKYLVSEFIEDSASSPHPAKQQ